MSRHIIIPIGLHPDSLKNCDNFLHRNELPPAKGAKYKQ